MSVNTELLQVLDKKALGCLQKKQFANASELWTSALPLAVNDRQKSAILFNIAQVNELSGDLSAARLAAEASLTLTGADQATKLLLKLCHLCLQQQDFVAAASYGKKLSEFNGFSLQGIAIQAKAAIGLLDKPKALTFLHLLAAHSTELSPPQLAYITHNLIKLSDIPSAADMIDIKCENYSGESWHTLLKAMVMLQSKQYADVITLIQDLDIESLPAWFKEVELLYVTLGQAYEQTENYQRAFECYAKMSVRRESKFGNIKRIDYLSAYSGVALGKLALLNDKKAPRLAFMVGFPRSGTTLVETALDTHENIVTISEQRTISQVIDVIENKYGGNYPEHLAQLSKADLLSLRQVYVDSMQPFLPKNCDGKLIVDKMPLHSIHLPLIKMLFPEAPIILSVRHPMDVVLSNFKQNFTLNNEMAFLTTLDSCAERLRAVDDFITRAQHDMALNILTVRYEDVVEDMDAQFRRLYDFLGVQYSEDYKNFHQSASEKLINTPSKYQVTKPLYDTAIGKWQKYREYLVNIEPVVSSVVNKYKYVL